MIRYYKRHKNKWKNYLTTKNFTAGKDIKIYLGNNSTIAKNCNFIGPGPDISLNLKIGDNSTVGALKSVEYKGDITIGNNSVIENFVKLGSGGKIGNRVTVGKSSIICTKCIIENDVVLGEKVILNNNVYIHKGVHLIENMYIPCNTEIFKCDYYDRLIKRWEKSHNTFRTFVNSMGKDFLSELFYLLTGQHGVMVTDINDIQLPEKYVNMAAIILLNKYGVTIRD